jgi:oligopeptide/dipeptide ABC transporter ATP-binding protein
MGTILNVSNVSKNYLVKSPGWFSRRSQESPRFVHAVDQVSFQIERGEVVGIVGESGCGKSTLGRMVAGIIPPSIGEIELLERRDVPSQALRKRNLRVQMIFQDPLSSLNPRRTVFDIIGEAPRVHGLCSRANQRAFVLEQMSRVGLDPTYASRLPHQFSGGQRQRIGIARALAVQPEILVCDEAVAALDVSIQAQILNLFMDLRDDLKLTYVFISHDLGIVERISDRIIIMYLGRMVEMGDARSIFSSPRHPYTQALLAAAPKLSDRKKIYSTISGEIPSPLAPPQGCHFHTRCPLATAECTMTRPALRQVTSGQFVACHHAH